MTTRRHALACAAAFLAVSATGFVHAQSVAWEQAMRARHAAKSSALETLPARSAFIAPARDSVAGSLTRPCSARART